MFGHPYEGRWGRNQWGTRVADPAARVMVDGTNTKTDLRSVLLDSVAAKLNLSAQLAVDSLALLTTEASVSVDTYQGRIPHAGFIETSTDGPVVLVELELPAGTVRVASQDMVWGEAPFWARLVSAGSVLRTLARGTDDLQLRLDDTSTRGPRFRDLFRADPPEGSIVTVSLVLLGDVPRNRVPLFRGRLERVSGFSVSEVSVDVVRLEAVEDRKLGSVVELSAYPNAPEESVGSFVPVVFGSVEAHEGVAVNANAKDRLALALGEDGPHGFTPGVPLFIPEGFTTPGSFPAKAWLSVVLTDASAFPASGVVRIGSEEIAYASKQGSELVGILRGVGGTTPTEHERGAEVVEVGEFSILLASHPLGSVENIRILDPNGNLGEPFPQPSSVDASTAMVTWGETPRVRAPDSETLHQRVHFRDVGEANMASSPAFAARENAAYRAFGAAGLGPGRMVLVTNADDLGVPGDILRVWIACIFDPESLGLPSSAGMGHEGEDRRKESTRIQGIPGAAAIRLATGQEFGLVPHDLVPPGVARQDEKTGDRFYEIPDPIIDVEVGDSGPRIISPDVLDDPGLWRMRPIAELMNDADVETEAVYFFLGIGEVLLVGRAPAIFHLEEPPEFGDDFAVSAELVFWAGWDAPHPRITSPFLVTLERDGEVLVSLLAKEATGFIEGRKEFRVAFDPKLFGAGEQFEELDAETFWKISPELGTSQGLWVGREIFIEVQTERRPPETKASIDAKGTVSNYFEVTPYLGQNPSQKDPAQDWAWFSDPARGGVVSWEAKIAGVEPKILETFWVVEHVPFLATSSRLPRVFADVQGIAPLGNPADVAEAIITQPPPLGMGLSATENISRPDYQAARSSLLSDGIRVDFSLGEMTSGKDLLEELAAQADCRETWDLDRHRLIRRPRPDTQLLTFRNLTDDHVLRQPPIRISRTELRQVVTRLQGRFRFLSYTGNPSGAAEAFSASSEARWGRREEAWELTLIRDGTAAQAILDRRLERERVPRWVVEFDVPPLGLELRFGDLVSLTHRDFAFAVGEVLGLTFEADGFQRVRISCVVWKE